MMVGGVWSGSRARRLLVTTKLSELESVKARQLSARVHSASRLEQRNIHHLHLVYTSNHCLLNLTKTLDAHPATTNTPSPSLLIHAFTRRFSHSSARERFSRLHTSTSSRRRKTLRGFSRITTTPSCREWGMSPRRTLRPIWNPLKQSSLDFKLWHRRTNYNYCRHPGRLSSFRSRLLHFCQSHLVEDYLRRLAQMRWSLRQRRV